MLINGTNPGLWSVFHIEAFCEGSAYSFEHSGTYLGQHMSSGYDPHWH